jgi:hypothetical protein
MASLAGQHREMRSTRFTQHNTRGQDRRSDVNARPSLVGLRPYNTGHWRDGGAGTLFRQEERIRLFETRFLSDLD